MASSSSPSSSQSSRSYCLHSGVVSTRAKSDLPLNTVWRCSLPLFETLPWLQEGLSPVAPCCSTHTVGTLGLLLQPVSGPTVSPAGRCRVKVWALEPGCARPPPSHVILGNLPTTSVSDLYSHSFLCLGPLPSQSTTKGFQKWSQYTAIHIHCGEKRQGKLTKGIILDPIIF